MPGRSDSEAPSPPREDHDPSALRVARGEQIFSRSRLSFDKLCADGYANPPPALAGL